MQPERLGPSQTQQVQTHLLCGQVGRPPIASSLVSSTRVLDLPKIWGGDLYPWNPHQIALQQQHPQAKGGGGQHAPPACSVSGLRGHTGTAEIRHFLLQDGFMGGRAQPGPCHL